MYTYILKIIGRRYDENGNLKQWWSINTLNHYHKKVQCIIDQYNKYRMPILGKKFHVSCILISTDIDTYIFVIFNVTI